MCLLIATQFLGAVSLYFIISGKGKVQRESLTHENKQNSQSWGFDYFWILCALGEFRWQDPFRKQMHHIVIAGFETPSNMNYTVSHNPVSCYATEKQLSKRRRKTGERIKRCLSYSYLRKI